MILNNSENLLSQLLITLTESDKKARPRIIMINSNNKRWRQMIINAINLDKSIFKDNNYFLTCKRYLDNKLELKTNKGEIQISLNNILDTVNSTDNMIITIENSMFKFFKGIWAEKSIKLVYIILQD